MSYYDYLWYILSHIKHSDMSTRRDSDSESFTSGGERQTNQPEEQTRSPVTALENKIVDLQSKFRNISNYISHFQTCQGVTRDDFYANYSGLYQSAFCCGVQNVLDDFYSIVMDVELKLLEGSTLSLLQIYVPFESMSVILNSLVEAINKILNEKVRGCKLLDICRLYKYCGDPIVEAAFIKIEGYCLKPFFEQLQTWMINDKLYDPYKEFFIDHSEFKHDIEESMSIMPNYWVNPDFVPNYMSLRIANKFMFIGQCYKIWQCQDNVEAVGEYNYDHNYILNWIRKMSNTREFDFTSFPDMVKEVWLLVNKDMKTLVERNGNLHEQLTMISEIYFLGRGEIFQEFIYGVENRLDFTVTWRSRRFSNQMLDEAIFNVYLVENKSFIGDIKLAIAPSSYKIKEFLQDAMIMVMDIRWPLKHLFSPELMNKYNRIFRFLLRLKHAQMSLTSSWIYVNKIVDLRIQRVAIEIRNLLIILIINLQNHFLTDVIANEMQLLQGLIDKCDTYTELNMALVTSVLNITNKLMLNTEKILNSLLKVFDVCIVFSRIVKKPLILLTVECLESFKPEMDEAVKSLFNLLLIQEKANQPVDTQNIVSNIDPNKFFRAKYDLLVEEFGWFY